MQLKGFVLASMIAVNAALVPMGVAKAEAPAAPAATTVQAATQNKAPSTMPSNLSDTLRKQTNDKLAARDQLTGIRTMGGALPGMALDENQPAVAGLATKPAQDAKAGIAYVQPYMEPDDFAHRNYCGAGAATVVISHFDADYAKNGNIDQLGREMDLDPDSGAWIKDIVQPVNDHLSQQAGHQVNWYRFGEAKSLDELRWMLDFDIHQNGVPLITGMDTGGMPGWGGQDIGHIIAVNGYWKDANGKEFVSYVDTAPPSSGYHGKMFVTVDLDTFWNAVQGNSAQVW